MFHEISLNSCKIITHCTFSQVLHKIHQKIFRSFFVISLAGSHTEAISPVPISPSNKAIYHLWTKQIHLHRTSHPGAMGCIECCYITAIHHWAIRHVDCLVIYCGWYSWFLPSVDRLHAIWLTFQRGSYRRYGKFIEKIFKVGKFRKFLDPLMMRHQISQIFLSIL